MRHLGIKSATHKGITVNLIISLILTLTAIFAPVQASAPMSAPIVEQVEQTPIPQLLGLDWLTYELALSGAVVPDKTFIVLTNELNCGAELSELGVGGCTHWLEDDSFYITVSPELAWTAGGTHVLHHELGHVVLDTHDECAVEAYAHQFTTATLWSYPECAA